MKNLNVKTMTTVALMTALICILGPISVPIGPVPISLSLLGVFFAVYILEMWKGTLSVLVYILLGLVGLPVFSGFQGGPQKLFGVTGGYIVGYLFLALVAGFFIQKFPTKWPLHLLGMILGLIVCYAFGTCWFVFMTEGYTFVSALAVCVFPFLLGDAAKIVIALLLGMVLKSRLKATNLI